MNKQRRTTLNQINDLIASVYEDLESCKDQEEEYRDNMPENLQGSERYEKADDAVNMLAANCAAGKVKNISTARNSERKFHWKKPERCALAAH